MGLKFTQGEGQLLTLELGSQFTSLNYPVPYWKSSLKEFIRRVDGREGLQLWNSKTDRGMQFSITESKEIIRLCLVEVNQ